MRRPAWPSGPARCSSGYDYEMSSSVPLWVTIALGAMAVLGPMGGTWLGALIAARHDQRRWVRETQREDTHWKREQEKTENEYWRERNLAAYATFTNCWINVSNTARFLIVGIRHGGGPNLAADADELIRLCNEMAHAVAIIEVEAPRSARTLAVTVHARTLEVSTHCQLAMVRIHKEGDQWAPGEDGNAARKAFDDAARAMTEFTDRVRSDLGRQALH